MAKKTTSSQRLRSSAAKKRWRERQGARRRALSTLRAATRHCEVIEFDGRAP